MTRTNSLRYGLLTAILLGVAAAATADATASPPNVILVFTDDQGWTDTSVAMMADRPDSRSDFYRTPALERMARRGMVFSNAYSPAPVCTPSRGSVQFGKTPARLRQTVVHDALAASRGIDCRNEVSLAQMVKAADRGYLTAHFGKWGFPPRPPEHAGYDVT
ncbi:MAG: sulfatase-like hydrolase/transferase, partial [Planctomycetes bacterium]|nr:sulfatase-like hydrolase/transferase [Planctomycetota bacterium]